MKPYRVLVTGSRTWADSTTVRDALTNVLDALATERGLILVHGGCRTGADKYAHDWAVQHARTRPVRVEVHPARWSAHGSSAGPRRNIEMVNQGADVCLAFIADQSRGATHCARHAEKASIPVRRWTA